MHIGRGEGYIDYPLSRVLGSWGYIIRDIFSRGVGIEVLCDSLSEGKKRSRCSFYVPFSSTCSGTFSHPFDAIIRYHIVNDDLIDPTCVLVISAIDLINK